VSIAVRRTALAELLPGRFDQAATEIPRPASGVAFAIKAEVVSTATTKREQRTVRRVTVETGL